MHALFRSRGGLGHLQPVLEILKKSVPSMLTSSHATLPGYELSDSLWFGFHCPNSFPLLLTAVCPQFTFFLPLHSIQSDKYVATTATAHYVYIFLCPSSLHPLSSHPLPSSSFSLLPSLPPSFMGAKLAL